LISPINNALMKLVRRAEMTERSHLVATFVDVGPLFTLLSSIDHQILYGRRGTGKTHALSYLSESVENDGDISILIDMRTVGSSGGIYADPELKLSERATRLLVDTLTVIHDKILDFVVEHDEELDLSRVGPILDRFAEAITEVSVVGTVEQEEMISRRQANEDISKASLGFNDNKIKVDLSGEFKGSSEVAVEQMNRRTGKERHRLHFGSLLRILTDLTRTLNGKRIWLLLDEWSEIPLDLQPYLADLLRRSIFPVHGYTVKIAAIEQRCRFRIIEESAGYVGIELGADAATSLNLDEFMVFDNDAERAKSFFSELIFRHVQSIMDLDHSGTPKNVDEFIQSAFTQRLAFEEFVRSVEGVPRDAINIIAIAAQKAGSEKISIPNIRHSAKTWYNRSKESAVLSKPEANELLKWIIDEVIGHRKARAFLIRSDIRNDLIEFLFDSRVLHFIKAGVSSHDQPGVRYNVYSIDYGCYVDLINTSRAPQYLFAVEGDEGEIHVDVPANDYRSIRRAILDLDKFYYRITK
jgi:hypothetical protein